MAKFGKKLVDSGLVESHFGNISIRTGTIMLITRSGFALDEIDENSVVEVDINKPSSFDMIASSEAVVHREIYRNTSGLAIIHAHSPFAAIESLLAGEDLIIPLDSEGEYFLHEIPLVRGGSGTRELARNTSDALRDRKGAIVKGHGTFAVGKVLEEAYVVATQIEHSCKIKYYYELYKK